MPRRRRRRVEPLGHPDLPITPHVVGESGDRAGRLTSAAWRQDLLIQPPASGTRQGVPVSHARGYHDAVAAELAAGQGVYGNAPTVTAADVSTQAAGPYAGDNPYAAGLAPDAGDDGAPAVVE